MMITINNYLSYIPSSENPLSCNVFFIRGKNYTYIYDVGSSDKAYQEIEKVECDKAIIISHFHEDHLSNIKRIGYKTLYVGSYTYKHTNSGIIVNKTINIDDDIKIEIISVSSVHAKGSLLLNINNEYCLIGDLIYSNKPINKSLFAMMLKDLEKIDTKYFVTGHSEDCIHEKASFIDKLKKEYKLL